MIEIKNQLGRILTLESSIMVDRLTGKSSQPINKTRGKEIYILIQTRSIDYPNQKIKEKKKNEV